MKRLIDFRKWLLACATIAAIALLSFYTPGVTIASSIGTAAYNLIENAGTPLTVRSTLNFSGSGITCTDDATHTRTNCVVSGGGGGGSFGGVNVQTSAYTLQASDSGLLVVMNCTSACAATLYGAPTSTYTSAIVSIGSTLATISLNSLDYNGTTSAPALTTGQILYFGSDGTNYFGNEPFTASTNITFTPGSNNVGISATGSGGSGNFTLIQRQTLASPASSVTFSSIPGTYTDLEIYITAASSTTGSNLATLLSTFNSDSSADYAIDYVQVVAGDVGGAQEASQTALPTCNVATNENASTWPGICKVTIPLYSGTTFVKAVTSLNALAENAPLVSGQRALYYIGGWWNSTAAITQIVFTLSAGNFVTGSVFELYGVH
jgi:hypothetical protein